MKIIIFRCDRIGDFLLSSILMNNMKKINNNIEFTVVCSKKNNYYVKNSFLVKNVLTMPDNFIKRIFFIFTFFKSNYDECIVLDGKKYSILSSIFLKSQNKILLTNKKNYYKYLKVFFNKVFFSKKNTNKIDELILIASYLNIKLNLDSAKYENNILNVDESLIRLLDKIINFTIFHFDEKWIHHQYINTYVNIEPKNDELMSFSEKLLSKTNDDLIITTGRIESNLLLFLISKFNKIKNNIYEYKYKGKSIFLIEKIDIHNLEFIISKSKCVITCHGATSHLSNMYNKKLLDIIDKSEEELFNNWTFHFTNNSSLIREPFSDLTKKIIDNT